MKATTTLLCVAMCLSGCAVFDEDLYQEADMGESAGQEDAEVSELAADACIDGEIPVLTESASLTLDLNAYNSVGLGYPKCIERQYQGPDAFFSLDVKAGERWNINAAPQNIDQDLAIIVLGDDCLATGCRSVRDRCGAGFDEDFAIVADTDKRYTISIDSLAPDVSGKVSLVLSKSFCGNGITEPGETCDGGEGCDEQCRRLIVSGTAAEGEPNDIFTGVEMIGLPQKAGQVTVTGAVGGPCDEDHYAFVVADGASVSVRMFAPGGAPCPENTPLIEMPLVDFLTPGGPTPVGSGKIGGSSGGCPYIEAEGTDPDFEFARGLPGSEYHLIINAFETDVRIPYELVFDIQNGPT